MILFSRDNRGFTLLELTIAVFVLIVAVTGTYSFFSSIIVVTSTASSRLTAAYLAQEGIEIVRNIRDTEWLNDSSWDDIRNHFSICSLGCEVDYKTGTVGETTALRSFQNNYLGIDTDGFYNYYTGSPSIFKRKVTVVSAETTLQISVLVMWKDRGKDYSFIAEETLYDWYLY